jgi:hypothetical protein
MPDEVPVKDPVTENQAMMTQEPVKVYEYQDHEAHNRVHMVLKNDPDMAQQVQNSPAGQAIMGALDSHVREHLAFIMRKQIEEELGTELPPMGQPLPEDVEKRLSKLIADAADQMMGKKQQQAAAQQQAQQQQDPIIQMKQQELQIRQSEEQRKAQADQAKQALDQQKLVLLEEKLDADQQMGVAELQLEAQKVALKADSEEKMRAAKDEAEGMKLITELSKEDNSE